MKKIPYGKQCIDRKDIAEVVKVLKGDWITQGPMIGEFEKKIASYCGSKYAVAVSSGTAALHLAVLAAGIKKNDEVITTPITFLATSNSVLYAGAKPVFADIKYETVNIDPAKINMNISKKTRAILPVHFAGLPCDMKSISMIAKKNDLIIIEDACHALGAGYMNKGKWYKTGSCSHSDMTVFSFHPVKHITSGEGGAITTNSKKLYEKLKCLRAHGIVKTSAMSKNKGPWYYEMRELGFNYRITDFQCALALSQIKKLDKFLSKRQAIAKIYNNEFSDMPGIEVPACCKDRKNAYHLYPLKINYKKFRLSRKNMFEKLNKKGIFPQVHYIPVYKQPYYKRMIGKNIKSFHNSEKYYERAVSLPIYPGLNEKSVRKVVRDIKKVLGVK